MSHSTPNPESNPARGEDRQPASPPPAPPRHEADTPVVPQSTAGTQPVHGDQPAITPPPERPVLPTPQSPANPMPHRHTDASSQGAAPTSQGPVSNSPVPPAPPAPVSQSPVPPAPQSPVSNNPVPPAPQGPVSQSPAAYNPQNPAGSQPYPPSAHPHSSTPPKSTPGAGNEFLTNVKNVWEFTRVIFTGRPAQAISAVQRTPHYIWLVLGSLVLVNSVFLATTFARGAGLTNSLISSFFNSFGMGAYYPEDGGLDWGVWFKLLIVGVIMLGLAVAARALTMYWTFRIGHVQVPYSQAAGILAAAVTPLVLVLVPVTILYLIPSPALAGVLSFLMLLVSAPLVWIAELMIFIGLNRTARFQRSPLIPHILMTMVWGLMIGLISFIYTALAMV